MVEEKSKEKIILIPFKSEYYKEVKGEWTGDSSGVTVKKTWEVCFISIKMR